MQDYRQSILDVHREIEEDLDFVLDVDNLAVREYYNMLDELDRCYISIEKSNDEKVITLYNSEEEGLEYLNKLKELSFFIKQKIIELNLKKIKMLLRRKKKKEELIIILRLLKKWEEFYEENKTKFNLEEQTKIEKQFDDIKNVNDEKIIIEKPNIKDNIKLTAMIGIAEVAGACKMFIPSKSKDEIIKERNKIKREEKIDKNIKDMPIPKVVHVVGDIKKVGISHDMKKQIENNSCELKKRQEKNIGCNDKIEEDIRTTPRFVYVTENVKKTGVSDSKKHIENNSYETKKIEEQEEKEDSYSIKDDIKIASAIALGAGAVVVLPTVAKAVAVTEAIKVITEPVKENDEKQEDLREDVKYDNDQKDIKEVAEFVEELEEENIEEKEEDIIKENGLEEELKKQGNDEDQKEVPEEKQENELQQEEEEPLTKEERFKILKINFENNEEVNIKKSKEDTILRVRQEEKKTKKEIKKKVKIVKKKNKVQKFISKMGRVAFLLSMNIALANILQKQATKSLIMGKPKVLRKE